MSSGPLRALGLAILATGLVWALSPVCTGHAEPWDAEGPYYLVGLTIAGLAVGGLAPRPLWAHFVGGWIGPLAYQALFLEIGPLILIGAILSLGYSIVFTLAAAIGARVWRSVRSGPNETTKWRGPGNES